MGDDLLKERKEKFFGFLKNRQVWVIGVLIIAVILGIYIRSMPMHDHGGRPGLWDIAKNDWTLGPDLDPWLFTRYAKTIVEEGGLPEIDSMRNVPLGFNTGAESKLLPYMIVATYWIVNLFGTYSVEFAAALFPVIAFAFTVIFFFLFVREIFVRKSEKSRIVGNIIALISTFFMIVIPVFLSRTLAGIPEKESVGFLFMFMAFWLFLKAWKTRSLKKSFLIGVLAGVATTLMGFVWGGVGYVFVTIAGATLAAFVLNKVRKREFLVYSSWLFTTVILMSLFSMKFSIMGFLTGLDGGMMFFVFFIGLLHLVLWNTKLSENRYLKKTKIPKNIVSLILGVVILVVLACVVFGPGFIIDKIKIVNQIMFKPTTGRWNTTVAENRQPFFTEWGASFGPFLRGIPVMFWLFFAGSIVLFKKMLNKLKTKESWILTGLYVLFLVGLVFSRYSGTSIMNGESFISKFFYYGSAALLIGAFVYYYIKYKKKGWNNFEGISFEYLFLFCLFILTLFTARSAVRLIMVLAPVVGIFVGYWILDLIYQFRKTRDDVWKIVVGILLVVVVLASVFVFWNYYKSSKVQAYGMVPSYYNQQWQRAMAWVRDNTDASETVFAHWWDYGYWLQSIGDRATVLDGGNAIKYWNYLMGRHVLTGDNQADALEFLYNHDATHLLIDSTDIGKYGAFASIGSNENLDRYSWIPVILSDKSQNLETSNGVQVVFQAGIPLDEDLVYEQNGSSIFLPAGKAGIAGVMVEVLNERINNVAVGQPKIVFVYNGRQIPLPLRYVYFNGEFYDFGSGVEGCISIIQKLENAGGQVQVDATGAAIYVTPRVMRGMLAQKYILNDPFEEFSNFDLVYTESNLIVDDLRKQGLVLGDFVYYQGLQGPIKIWDITYTGSEQIKEEYLDRDYSKYLSWEL